MSKPWGWKKMQQGHSLKRKGAEAALQSLSQTDLLVCGASTLYTSVCCLDEHF